MGSWRHVVRSAVLALLCALVTPQAGAEPVNRPDRTEPAPKRLRGVEVEERPDAELPLEVVFADEGGKSVTLREYFDGTHPVILTLNYSDCPMLCSLVLNGLVDGLKKLAWSPGKQFRIVTISIDPSERPERAQKTKSRYLTELGRAGAEPGWHFLTGSEASIRAVADAVGFRYSYNEARKEYVHPAAIVIATPRARVARYLYGVEFDERTLRLSLAEASEGKIASTVDRLLLFCFHYDESEGRYAPVARNIMKVGGAVAVVFLGAFLGALWLAEHKKKKLIRLET